MVNSDNSNNLFEDNINRAIEGIQWMIHPLYGKITPEEKEAAAVITISAATIKKCELQINTLKTAPRDAAKLREILQAPITVEELGGSSDLYSECEIWG